MLRIDQYAYSNRLRFVHPAEKALFVLITLVICLTASSPAVYLLIILLMSGVVILQAGIPVRFYLKLVSIPLSFLILGVLTVAVSFSREPFIYLWGFMLDGYSVGITAGGLSMAAGLLCKSLGAVCCLYFLALTTPMVEIIYVLKKARVPGLFIELMSLVYRFIFVLLETADKIYVSQSSRWGYATLKTSYFSLGQLVSNLFTKSYYQSKMLFTALSARCYKGELNVLEESYDLSVKNLLLIVVVGLVLLAVSLYSGDWRFLSGGVYR